MAEMRLFAEIIFWTAVVAIAYTYAGYPLLLMLLSKLRGKPVQRREVTPPVTVIIAAYNEERDLARKLENTLAVDYPKEKLEILVTSDCSSDRTDDIVRSFADRGVRLHRQEERLGKTAAQNAAVEKANGEVLLFSDATTHYEPDVLRRLVPSFADDTVGCVTGNVIYSHDADSSVSHGTRSYWNYEFLLKKHESAITSLIRVNTSDAVPSPYGTPKRLFSTRALVGSPPRPANGVTFSSAAPPKTGGASFAGSGGGGGVNGRCA